MKKIALLFAAVAFMTAANAQLVVGLQGGYHQQKDINSLNEDYTFASSYVGGLRVGYMITPKLYVGVAGSILGNGNELYIGLDSAALNGMMHPIKEHSYADKRSGWNVSPQVRYELLKYGNMYFHLLLQGTYSSLSYTNRSESYTWVTYPNPNEYWEQDPYDDSISCTSWSVSLRPTLTYEFSKHLSAELSLDFLSIGYASETTHYDATSTTDAVTGITTAIEPYSTTRTTIYGGLNTLMETLRWESPMLRLGFNWTF
ncbi:MAG: hypothetical protein J6V98_02400 [Bacteroidales bacterium]|nr:hypothetical protein [Bacteroidales bacterium]